jgi:1,4-dihydroxy-2-naphthoyl-CoA hydrolase
VLNIYRRIEDWHGAADPKYRGTGGPVFVQSAPDKMAFGTEINASHLRPTRSGTLTAVGTPIQVGFTNRVCEVRIHDEDEKLVCVSRCTLAVVDD